MIPITWPEILVASSAAVLLIGIVLTILGSRKIKKAQSLKRVQLPARLINRAWAIPGEFLTIEYPGPDGEVLTKGMLVPLRRGLGAKPTFAGYVWVNESDPSDVMTRATGRTGLGWAATFIGIAFIILSIVAACIGLFAMWADSGFTSL